LDSDQHLFAEYDVDGTWTLGYNLFADVWLRTNVVESSVRIHVDSFCLVSSLFRYIAAIAISFEA
jgi:hypothetical protein